MTDPTDLDAVPTMAELKDPVWGAQRRAAHRAWFEDQRANLDDPKKIESLEACLAAIEDVDTSIAHLLVEARNRGDVLTMAYAAAARSYFTDPGNSTKKAQYDRLEGAAHIALAVIKQTRRDMEEEIARLREEGA